LCDDVAEHFIDRKWSERASQGATDLNAKSELFKS
jgi:hypothetical protein